MKNKTVYILKSSENNDSDRFLYYLNGNSTSFTNDFDNAIKFHSEECARLMKEFLATLGKPCGIVARSETYTEII